jgi:uncharacterized protein
MTGVRGKFDYRTRICGQLASIDRAQWESLRQADDLRRQLRGPAGEAHGVAPTCNAPRPSSALSPFLTYDFLVALESSGSVGGRSGWQPRHLLIERHSGHQMRLVGAVVLYQKAHSYGEYVFDWAWANAYHQHGLNYYPKLAAAIPFTPVPGPRLLAVDEAAADRLLDELVALAARGENSSLHILFPDDHDAARCAAHGLMIRNGIQFHWHNPGFADFDDYLASLTQSKRKKIRAERRKVADAGVSCRVLTGEELTSQHWTMFYRCYANTYAEHGSTPYLKPKFFETIANQMPASIAMAIASDRHGDFAASLLIRDDHRIYGRYWGAVRSIPFVHFETAYYSPIQWAIEQRISIFEGGAQGEHKLARGFAPVKTCSAHWLAHPGFATAVEQFLRRERNGIDSYLDELNERLPPIAAAAE